MPASPCSARRCDEPRARATRTRPWSSGRARDAARRAHGLARPGAAREGGEATGWAMAMPDVFSIRHTTVEAYLEPMVHEIKVRRADLLADLRRGDKREAYLRARQRVLVRDRAKASPRPTRFRPACGVMVGARRRRSRWRVRRRGGRCSCRFGCGWRWRGRRRSKAGASKTRRRAARRHCRRLRRGRPAAPRHAASWHAQSLPHRPTPARPIPPTLARQALWAALALILVWGANFSVQKAVFAALSPGGFLFVRYLIMPVAAAVLLCWQLRPALAARVARRLLALLRARHGRPPAARRPGDLRHPLVDRVLELADPRLRAGLHAADPALERPRDS